MLFILKLLKLLLPQASSILSSVVPAVTMPDGPITPSYTETMLEIVRNPKLKTSDGTFGILKINGSLVCESVENSGKDIEEGLYDAEIDESPRLGYMCPHIHVPERDGAAGGDAGIRIHILNTPSQSEGCIGTGTRKDGDSEDNSKAAFGKMMALLPPPGVHFKVLIQ